jgi:hypothetical protein
LEKCAVFYKMTFLNCEIKMFIGFLDAFGLMAISGEQL